MKDLEDFLDLFQLHLGAQVRSGICRWGQRSLKKALCVLYTSTKPEHPVLLQERSTMHTRQRDPTETLPNFLVF